MAHEEKTKRWYLLYTAYSIIPRQYQTIFEIFVFGYDGLLCFPFCWEYGISMIILHVHAYIHVNMVVDGTTAE